MILLHPEGNGTTGTAIAIFGTGLLGLSILESLQVQECRPARELPLHWPNPYIRRSQLQSIEGNLRRALKGGARLSVVWTAGRAGFHSGDAETAAELQSFGEVLAMSERLAREYPQMSFHLVSSAGGLFEGQRHVTSQSRPRPRRPYGHLKLRQEELLQAGTLLTRRIYRVTTAYGYARPRFRAGLVTTLILHGLLRTVTTITGMMDTLRDFVFAGDVGRFIAERLVGDAYDSAGVVLLARGPAQFCPRGPAPCGGSDRTQTARLLQRKRSECRGHHLFRRHCPGGVASVRYSGERRNDPARCHLPASAAAFAPVEATG